MWGKFGLPGIGKYELFLGVGVPFFFVLSGFILTYNYAPTTDGRKMARLVAYRAARIWPLHLVTLALFLALMGNPESPTQTLVSLIPNIFLLHGWSGMMPVALSFNAVSWSLSVELAFYVALPFLLLCNNRMLVAIAVTGAAIALVWADMTWVQHVNLTDMVVSGQAIVTMHPLANLPMFIAGIIIARLFADMEARPGVVAATAMEIAVVALMVVYMVWNRQIGNSIADWLNTTTAVRRWLMPTTGIVAFVPAVFIFAIGSGLLSKALTARWLIWLGEISFAFYLCHQPIMNWLAPRIPSHAGLAAALLASVAVSAILHYGIEMPAQRYLRGRIDRLTGKTIAA